MSPRGQSGKGDASISRDRCALTSIDRHAVAVQVEAQTGCVSRYGQIPRWRHAGHGEGRRHGPTGRDVDAARSTVSYAAVIRDAGEHHAMTAGCEVGKRDTSVDRDRLARCPVYGDCIAIRVEIGS